MIDSVGIDHGEGPKADMLKILRLSDRLKMTGKAVPAAFKYMLNSTS